MNQELEDIVRGAFKAADNADLEAFFNMMADDIEQVDELTKKWSRGKANVVAALTPLFSMVTPSNQCCLTFTQPYPMTLRLSRACSTRAMFWKAK